MILTKEQILQAQDLPQETVDVPEWGGEVVVRTLTGYERAQMIDRYQLASKSNANEPFDVHLVAATLSGADGQPLFASLADVHAVGVRSGAVIGRLYLVARRLNGFDTTALKKSLTKTQS